MDKVTGIKSVDFVVKASGYGVVNFNGQVDFHNPDPKAKKALTNHSIPKLRGFSNETGKISENGYRFLKETHQVNFKENPMYIGQNCIRHHLFKDQSHDFHFANKDNAKDLLISVSGLLRGYVIPSVQWNRASPLYVEDFVDQLGNGNYEQFANSGAKDSNSIFSKITFGETSYLSKGSISIENLQFISLDKKFDREAIVVKSEKEGIALAESLTKFITDLDPMSKNKPLATFGKYYRKGSIFKEEEFGILLNDDAIDNLVQLSLEMLSDLSIRQAQGWMSVDDVECDYNDSSVMRVFKSPDEVVGEKSTKYASYYCLVE